MAGAQGGPAPPGDTVRPPGGDRTAHSCAPGGFAAAGALRNAITWTGAN